MTRIILALTLWLGIGLTAIAEEAARSSDNPIIIGLNYPRTGHYKEEGLAQMRGALLAIDEINKKGGLLGRQIKLINRDTASRPEKAMRNVDSMIDEGAVMLFGSVSSAVAVAASQRARERDTIYFATIGYANNVTTENGHSHVFRESTSATMSARALGQYLTQHFPGKKYFYVTADYSWGHSTEESLRKNTGTEDSQVHPGTLIPFPGSHQSDYTNALKLADESGADVVVLSLYGQDLVRGMRTADSMGLTRKAQIVAPNLTQTVIEQTGPSIMVGVLGTEHWFWRVPEIEKSGSGLIFIKNFSDTYDLYPASAAASAYTVVHQWADAVRRSNSLESNQVISALEDHEYQLLKGKSQWRGFDHQNVQTVYVVRVNDRQTINSHPSRQDYFEVVHRLEGENAAVSFEDWKEQRESAGLPDSLN